MDTKQQHTPGPWKLERPSRKRGGNFDEKQAITAGAYGTVCVCTRADARSDTDSPNARLIAAAPDLLLISQRLVAWDKKWPKYSDHTGASELEMNEICEDAAKALARAATGKGVQGE